MSKETFVTATTTASYTGAKYSYPIDDFIEWVYKAKTESDAVNNIPILIKAYLRRMSFWEVFKLLLTK